MSYGKIHSRFWTDKKVRGWSESARLLAIYLISGPHRNLLGACRVPDGYIAADMGWSERRTAEVKAELARAGFALFGEDGWLCVINQLRYDPLDNPNQARSAIKLFEAIDDETIRATVASRLLEALERFKDQFDIQKAALQSVIERSANRSETVSEELTTPIPDLSFPEPSPSPARKRACGYSPEFESFWAVYPRLEGNPKAPAYVEWQKAIKAGEAPAMLIAAAARYAAACAKPDAPKVAHARTWLHQKRWEVWRDAPMPVSAVPAKSERDIWRDRLDAYVPGGRWLWGARPESGYCDAPEDLLTEWKRRQEQAA